MTTDAYNEQGDLARAMGVEGPGVCICGLPTIIGFIRRERVGLCAGGDHVVTGRKGDGVKVYIHVENPEDVIETAT